MSTNTSDNAGAGGGAKPKRRGTARKADAQPPAHAAPPDVIRIRGAREHNLRGVDLDIPKGRLVCFTGVSGSGKSSLAFDTLYAEGQRRYIESLSSYARQFLGELPRPDVDQITGLAPSISIQQKTSGWNPRSTVGTITQIHDYLRVLYARAGDAACPTCGAPISAQTRDHMVGQILALGEGTRILLLAPRVRGQKGEHRDLFAELVQQGFVRARVDGEVTELASPPPLDRYRRHDVEVVVDRLTLREGIRTRVGEALDLALSVGGGSAIVHVLPGDEKTAEGRDLLLSAGYACMKCQVSYEPPVPQSFSFNSPQGMCPECDGLGTRVDFVPELLVPDPSLPFYAPCVKALRTIPGRWRRHIYQGVADHFGFDIRKPWKELPQQARDVLLFGAGDTHITFTWRGRGGTWKHGGTYEGVVAELNAKYRKAESAFVRGWYEQFMRQQPCKSCRGARLRPQALAVRLRSAAGDALNIDELCRLPIGRCAAFFEGIQLDAVRTLIAAEPLKEIRARLGFLLDVGLDYLTLDRSAPTLSGGESQRIRLASQIGSGLVGVLYVLDEPSIGLHPRDNRRLLRSLERLRDMGNTVVVVEHDRETMEAADEIVDFGPGPGVRGGEVVARGGTDEVAASARSRTGAYLSNRESIEVPKTRRPVTPAEPAPLPTPPKRKSRRQ